MLKRFREYLERFDPSSPLRAGDDHVLVAVSGGIDSMTMLHLFREAGFEPGVAHANFNLRGTESDGDEAFVKEYCTKHKLSFYSKRFETKNYAEGHGISTQMAARELRYAWFNELMEQGGYHWLATAHHINDNLETVLLRWASGAGLDQLMGIPVRNDRIIRPMMFATREEIKTFAQSEHLAWREDSSNPDTTYSRNFIRHEVIPKLKQINPSLESTFTVGLEKLEGASELMRRGLGQLRDAMIRQEGTDLFIDKSLLLLLQHPAYICFEFLKDFGFEFERCRQLVTAASSGQTGARFLSTSHQAVVDREQIIVAPLSHEAYHDVWVEDGQDKAVLGPWILHVRKERGKTISTDRSIATLDASALRFPLLWRKWKPGDRFVPLGMTKAKKLSDFLVDEQVPLVEKDRVTVVCSGDEVIWVAGYRPDNRYKITAKTETVLTMRLEPRK